MNEHGKGSAKSCGENAQMGERRQDCLEVSSTIANAAVRQVLLELCSGRLRPFACVDVQNGCSRLRVGQREHQLPVKPVSPRNASYLKTIHVRCDVPVVLGSGQVPSKKSAHKTPLVCNPFI